MKQLFCALWLSMLTVAVSAQQLPLPIVGDSALQATASGNDMQIEDPEEASPDPSEFDYRWQDTHEKERNIAFATCAAAVIGAIYTGTRSIEARSRAEEKKSEYQSLWYGSTAEDFSRVKSEYNEYREDGNFYAVSTAALGALAMVGLGFSIYWSF